MAAKKNTTKKDVSNPRLPYEPLSARGKGIALAGGALVIAGFVVLSFADALGRNLPARVAPFLLIGGYAAIGVGLFLPPAPPAPPAP